MDAEHPLYFASFCLNPRDKCLWRDGQRFSLTPTLFLILNYFLHHPGQVVPIDTLKEAVWGTLHVSNATVVTFMKTLRRVLGYSATAPQWLETVRGGGYRFLVAPHVQTSSVLVSQARRVVGREAELVCLQHYQEEAAQGRRRVVFVTGELGIGKTAVFDAFEQVLLPQDRWWIARGEGVEHYETGEPYLPLLTALDRLCQGPDGQEAVECLRRVAPTWLVQMPWLLSPADTQVLQRESLGLTAQRMLREFAMLVETLARRRPLLLMLEDLHWSDHATVEALAYLARRPEAARLLVLGTYRPEDIALRQHPLQAVTLELRTHRYCEEVALPALRESEVATYLNTRFLHHRLPEALAHHLYERTEGHPFFLVNVVDDLVRQGVLAEVDGVWQSQGELLQVMRAVPADVRQIITQRLTGLSAEEQQVLCVGSVVGTEFSSAAVAAGVASDMLHVEAVCESLARRRLFLTSHGVSAWPDGTIVRRFRFQHALYQHVLYEHIPEGQRGFLHYTIGARLERGFAEQTEEIAAELAMHFDRGRDEARAHHYDQHTAGQVTGLAPQVVLRSHRHAGRASA